MSLKEILTPHWTKTTSGEWVVKIPKAHMAEVMDTEVTVTRKDGTSSTETIIDVIENSDHFLCIVAKKERGQQQRPRYTSCQACGVRASRFVKIYGSGECRDCYEERKQGY